MKITRFSVKLRDNYEIINNWGREYFTPNPGWGNLLKQEYMICDLKKVFCSSSDDKTNYQEITFEEFKKYILKEETQSSNILTTCL
jgi:hypothetical protein